MLLLPHPLQDNVAVKTELAADNLLPFSSGLPAEMGISCLSTPSQEPVSSVPASSTHASSQLASEAFWQGNEPTQPTVETNTDGASSPPSNPQRRVQRVLDEARHRRVQLKLCQGVHAYSIPHPSAFHIFSSSHPHLSPPPPIHIPSSSHPQHRLYTVRPFSLDPPLTALIAYLFATHPHTHPATHPI
jgi:hypothetical protein